MDNLGKDFKARFLDVKNRGIKSASMLKRSLALIIDILVINFTIAKPFQEILVSYMSNATFFQTIPDNIYLIIFQISVLSLLYFSLFQYYFQQTIGMMVLQIYVMPKASFIKCLIRNLFVLPFFPFSILWVLEPIYLNFKGIRWLEKVTGTMTVEASNESNL